MGEIIIGGIFSTIPLLIIWIIVEKVLFGKNKKEQKREQKDEIDKEEKNYPNK